MLPKLSPARSLGSAHRFHACVIGEDFFFSGERAKRELGYSPIVSRDEAELRTAAWAKLLPL